MAVLTVPLAISQTLSFVDAVRQGKYDNAINHVVEWAPDSIQPQIEQFVDRAQGLIGPTDSSGSALEVVKKDTATASADSEKPAVASSAQNQQAFDLDEEKLRAMVDQQISDRLAADAGNGQGMQLFGLLGTGAKRVWSFALDILQLGILIFLIPFYFFYFTIIWPKLTISVAA